MSEKQAAIYDGGTKHTFKVGQRVRPSAYGIERFIFEGSYRGVKRSEQSGQVIAVDEFGCPTVKWDGKKTPKGYYYGFIDIDRRRTTRRSKP